MTAQLKSWAAALGGDVIGRGVNCPGPGHSARDRSLSVTPSAASPDEFVIFSHSGDDWQVCRDFVRAQLGFPPFRPGQGPKVAPQRERKPVEETPANDREPALRLWRQALEPRGTLVEAYLRNRCLELPDEAANEAIRYHPSCPLHRENFPAMVCLVRNIITSEPQAIHRTALTADGTAIKRNGKTFRLSLGPIAGGAIKIDPDDDVTQGICVGEGVETCLSGRQMGLRPVWSMLSTGGIANFPILPGVDGLHIFAENDGASAKAVEACARRWYETDRDVIIVEPDTSKDLNDELREAAAR
jgi:putative DNA primase/helicase